MSINWNDIANTILQTVKNSVQPGGPQLQPINSFEMPLQINSNAPDVLMQQAKDTNENYYGYIQQVTGNNINNTILFAAAGIFIIYLFFD